jgi:16S rRNA (cytosine967-C5)-methyltransferase
LLLVDNLPHPGRLREAFLGYYHPQALTSALATLSLAPQPDELVCDLCAAPGSKTSHMAQLMHNQGVIVANELARERLFMLEYNLKHLGIINVITTRYAGQNFPLRCKFARVLVDAPCSGIGAARRRPELLWRPSRQELSGLARLQAAILVGVADAVRPGGRLVYSVCTFPRAETDAVLRAFRSDRSDFEPCDLPGPDGLGPVHRVWPHRHGTDAMFYAGLRRTGDRR